MIALPPVLLQYVEFAAPHAVLMTEIAMTVLAFSMYLIERGGALIPDPLGRAVQLNLT